MQKNFQVNQLFLKSPPHLASSTNYFYSLLPTWHPQPTISIVSSPPGILNQLFLKSPPHLASSTNYFYSLLPTWHPQPTISAVSSPPAILNHTIESSIMALQITITPCTRQINLKSYPGHSHFSLYIEHVFDCCYLLDFDFVVRYTITVTLIDWHSLWFSVNFVWLF